MEKKWKKNRKKWYLTDIGFANGRSGEVGRRMLMDDRFVGLVLEYSVDGAGGAWERLRRWCRVIWRMASGMCKLSAAFRLGRRLLVFQWLLTLLRSLRSVLRSIFERPRHSWSVRCQFRRRRFYFAWTSG